MATDYVPRPLDVENVELDEVLLSLVESLSHNAHEVWAQRRMSEGWTWGRERSDELRQHPCLIPYADLPESEKDYDRKLVVRTILGILALGFDISASPRG